MPSEFVRDGEIVLNISYDATGNLQLGNEYIEFTARFGGKPREIMVPVEHVQAIYARESGQGMSFPVTWMICWQIFQMMLVDWMCVMTAAAAVSVEGAR